MGTLAGLSGEYVTFDQNGRKCNFKLVAAGRGLGILRPSHELTNFACD